MTVVKEKGGSARREVGKALVEGVGGRLEWFHFPFGEDDLIALVDLPDNGAAAALSTYLVGSGRFTTFVTVPLLTPEEVDAAMHAYDVQRCDTHDNRAWEVASMIGTGGLPLLIGASVYTAAWIVFAFVGRNPSSPMFVPLNLLVIAGSIGIASWRGCRPEPNCW